MSPVSVLSCNSVSSGTVSCRLASNSLGCAAVSRTLAVTSMRSPACSMSKPILSEAWLATTSTSAFFQDFTSIRPLATLWITTTGRVWTAKCFSICWLAAPAAVKPEQRKTAAPNSESTPGLTSRRSAGKLKSGHEAVIFIFPVPMLVDAPFAIHHRGQQFGFLLIRIGQIFTRQFVLRGRAQTALADSNKIINLLEVLPERVVHRRSAGKLHVIDINFLFIQNFRSFCEGNLRGEHGNAAIRLNVGLVR